MWNRLQATVDEQAAVLMRTAFSPIVRESGDLSAGVFDVEGRMLAQAVTGTPGHVNTMATACAKFFDSFPREEMKPGDIYLTNDPWLGAGHLNDFVLLKPCFLGGQACRFRFLHQPPGRYRRALPGAGRQRCLRRRPLRAADPAGRGRPAQRTFPHPAQGQLPLPAAGRGRCLCADRLLRHGRAGTVKMMRDFGIETLDALSRRILETSEATTREAGPEPSPTGSYAYEMAVDGYDLPVTLKAGLDIDGDRLRLDFHGSAPPSQHGINVPLNYTEAYAVFGLKCAIAPDIPNNHGSLAVFEVTAPEGTILNAQKPAPVCSRHILGQLLPDVALGCLAHLMPEAVPAEGAATLWDLPLKGTYQGQSFTAELVHNGGTGARAGKRWTFRHRLSQRRHGQPGRDHRKHHAADDPPPRVPSGFRRARQATWGPGSGPGIGGPARCAVNHLWHGGPGAPAGPGS